MTPANFAGLARATLRTVQDDRSTISTSNSTTANNNNNNDPQPPDQIMWALSLRLVAFYCLTDCQIKDWKKKQRGGVRQRECIAYKLYMYNQQAVRKFCIVPSCQRMMEEDENDTNQQQPFVVRI